jgi:hypothetical protein
VLLILASIREGHNEYICGSGTSITSNPVSSTKLASPASSTIKYVAFTYIFNAATSTNKLKKWILGGSTGVPNNGVERVTISGRAQETDEQMDEKKGKGKT